MPVLSAFFGMVIRIFHNDHNPPHIHVGYGEKELIVAIDDGRILHGRFSPG